MSKDGKKQNKVSVMNWIGTLLLSAIPVVNLVMWFVWAFRAKRASKRTFSIACIILFFFFAALCAVAVTLWGREMLEWARSINPHLFTEALSGQ